jgi:hypothetical protein
MITSTAGAACECQTIPITTPALAAPIAPDLAAVTPTAPAGQPVAASCVASVPYEQTSPAYLNTGYFLELPIQPPPCMALAGLRIGPLDPAVAYGRVHLDLFLQGGQIIVPAGIGVDEATHQATDLFTESDTGIVWFNKANTLTLGQLFLEWGHPLGQDPSQIGSLHSLPGRSITWYVNGSPVADIAGVVLHNHDEIEGFEDETGAPQAAIRTFSWPPGY